VTGTNVPPVHQGLFIPQFGELADPRLLADFGRRAEQAGWDGLFVWDHIQYRAPAAVVLDPWVTLAAIGAATDRLRLGAMVTPLARRRPWVVARQVAALDLLTQGRMVLGVGLGLDDSGRELSTFGEELDARTRAEMLDEALEIIHGLLSGEEVQHQGPHYVVHGATFLPTPVQKPLPTWVAARWPKRAPLRRAARYQGVFAINITTPDDVEELRRQVGLLRVATGPFDIVVAPEPGWPPADWAQAGVTWLLTPFSQFGTTAADVARVVDAGPGEQI
jgi:alkanesulfonate monooxygenase SsuD/methylene tetrahydromethanopterin reductase-like flavin-dependent oxidoreductase (luciferase family)